MELRPAPGWPRREETRCGFNYVALLGVQTAKVLMIEHQRHPGALVDVKHVCRTERDVVVFQNQPPSRGLRELVFVSNDSAIARGACIVITSAHVNHDHGV